MDSAWSLLGLAGALGGAAVVLVGVAFSEAPLALPLAIIFALASYGLWQLGTERMVGRIYAEVGGNPAERDAGRDRPRTEDWHQRSVDDPTAARVRAPAADTNTTWPWNDPFFEEGAWDRRRQPRERARDAPGHTSGNGNAGRWGGRNPDQSRRGRARDRWVSGAGRGATVGGSHAVSGDQPHGPGPQTFAMDPALRHAYEVLGVQPGADTETVREAYRDRVKEVHPDHGGSAAAFQRVRDAYELIRSNRNRDR